MFHESQQDSQIKMHLQMAAVQKKKPLLQMQFTNDNLINRIPEAHEVTKPVAETKSECQHCQVSPGDLSDVGRGVWLADEPFPGLWRASN
jgi:hypothetical protein